MNTAVANLEQWTERLSRAQLPLLRRTLARVTALAQAELAGVAEPDARDIASAVSDDPCAVARLFARLAERRHSRSVATIEGAVLMLGTRGALAELASAPAVEAVIGANVHAHAGLLRVVRRAQRAARFALAIAAWRNDPAAEEVTLAALLHDLAELVLWCVDPARMLRIRAAQRAHPGLRSADAQRAELGVTVAELQRALALRWQLPELLVSLADERYEENPRARVVTLAVRLSRHSARSWNDPALPDDWRELAMLLSVGEARVRELVGAPAG